MTAARTPPAPLASVLRTLGLLSEDDFSELDRVVEKFLAKKGHHARVTALRRGTLVLSVDDPQAAQWLNYDVDDLLVVVKKNIKHLRIERCSVRVTQRAS